MARQRVDVSHRSARPVGELFALLADHNRLGPVLGADVRRIEDGDGDINGVGSVRRITLGGLLSIEETVTAVEPGRSIDYRITRGGYPIRHHRGHLEFNQRGDGSQVDWHIEFDSALPLAGSLIARVLERVIGRGLGNVG